MVLDLAFAHQACDMRSSKRTVTHERLQSSLVSGDRIDELVELLPSVTCTHERDEFEAVTVIVVSDVEVDVLFPPPVHRSRHATQWRWEQEFDSVYSFVIRSVYRIFSYPDDFADRASVFDVLTDSELLLLKFHLCSSPPSAVLNCLAWIEGCTRLRDRATYDLGKRRGIV